MSVKELKKELSALSGVDFFNPKYRNVFKKYFPNDISDSDNNESIEEERLNELLGVEGEKEDKSQEKAEKKEETNTSESNAEENISEETDVDIETEDKEESIEDSGVSEEPSTDESQGNNVEEKEQPSSDSQDTNDANQQLLETKVELQLVKSGVREERIESAKKLFMSEIKSLEDLNKLKDLIKLYPEWLKKEKTNAKSFGMSLDDNGDGLTEEQKRLKELGIDPR